MFRLSPDPHLVRALAVLVLLALAPATLVAQGDTTFTGWLRFPSAEGFSLRTPSGLQPTTGAGERWSALLATSLDSIRANRARTWRLRQIYRGPIPGEEDSLPAQRTLMGINRNLVDLAIDGQARAEIRTERLKNLRCTSAQYLDLNSGCRAGFKAPRLDTYLSVRAGGLIGRRLHVDIDYDTERDFTARNNLQVYYEGLEDEIVQRVEVGTVTFRPPPSRFIASNIPANNFGVNASFEIGAFQIQAIAATQKGSVMAERTFTVGGTTVQPQDREARDLDFESGRFFWVIDPTIMPGYPVLDILNLNLTALPAAAQVTGGDVRVYRHRPPSRTGVNPNLGGIGAVAIGTDTTQKVTAIWELLRQDVDYYVDGSGLWVALSARLDQNDYLAVSYNTSAGRVGTFPSVDTPVPAGQPPVDTLRLIVQPRVDATRGTFRHEMRQIYRVAGSDLDPSSLLVNLSANRSERPLRPGAQGTYLAELGLATPQDPTIFNKTERLFPRTRDPSAIVTMKEYFIIFPTLQPFADPVKLTTSELNDSLYRTPDYLLYSEGPSAKFVFRLRYNASSTADRSQLDLGALQIRDGSEVLYYNGRRLERGIDYSMNYDLGRVTFLDPNLLFGNSSGTIQAKFEERGVFAIAPTQIFGLATRYSLGETGGINLMGLYQVEQSAFNRPQLGLEASAHMIGGISTDLRFQPGAITRLMNSLTNTPSSAQSTLTINAELALTRPDPNRSGQAYLEEFEGDPGIELSLRETVWSFGSRPQSTAGVDQVVGLAFDTADAVQLTWQNLVPTRDGTVLELRARDIDPRIQVVGQLDNLETVLFMALQPDTAGGQVRRNSTMGWTLPARLNAPRWRTMVTALSTTGVDLSKNEFLEFWVFKETTNSAENAGVSLVVDLGNVSEDAIAIAPESLTVAGNDSSFRGRQFVGLGRLDTERQSTGIFNAATDDNGILGDRPDELVINGQRQENVSLCREVLSNVVPVYPWGDLSARCSNGNGSLDAEDLDSDNSLDATGENDNVLRWVIDLRNSQYFVRNGVENSNGRWQLYRLPLRSAGDTVGTPNIRLVKQMRIGVVAENDGGNPDLIAKFGIARMKFLGAPWVRRAERPIQGIAGSTAAAEGEIIATTVSTENIELNYESPPGVVGGLDDKNQNNGGIGVQVNERSLRLIGVGVDRGQRVEAYYRFPSGPQNLLGYREMRAWFRGRGAGWGPNQDLQAYIRVGSDSRNFYQYATDAEVTRWTPEARIDLEKWRNLRANIESRRLQGLVADSAARVACGGDTVSVAYVLCDGPYMVHIQDPAISPPNLARVQEVSAGILYRGALSTAADSVELWIDDIRLVEPISNTGSAIALDARLTATDAVDFNLGYIRQDGYFQQLGGEPTYRTTGSYTVGSGVRIDRFLPKSLGISLPLQVGYARTDVDPTLLTGTDIEASDLERLRRPANWNFAYSLSVSRVQRSKSWILRGLLDPISMSWSSNNASNVSELSKATSSARNFSAIYQLQPGRTAFSLGLRGLAGKLPGFLKNSDFGKSLGPAELALSPTTVRLSTGWSRVKSDLLTYQVPVFRAADSAIVPILSEQHEWRNSAGMSWTPLGMLTLSSDVSSTRDLRRYNDSTALARLVNDSRRTFLGTDVGVERDRQFTTSIAVTPRVTSWFRPRYITASGFVLSRSLTSRQPIRLDGDTAGAFILPQTLNNTRTSEVGAGIEAARLLGRVFGDSSRIARSLSRLRLVDVSDRFTRSSTFDLASFDPGARYHLALGGLDDFLRQGNDTAIGAAEVRTTSVNSGADLPFGLSFTLGYTRDRTTRFQRSNSGFIVTETKLLEWPRGSVRITRSLTGLAPLSTVTLGAQFRTSDGTAVTPSVTGPPIESRIYSSSLVPDATISLKNGMVFTFSYNMLDTENKNSGSTSRSEQNDLSAGFNHSFTLPRSLGRTRRLVRTQVSTVFSKGTSCLQRLDEDECTSISDTRRQEVRAAFDSDLARVITGSLSFSYSLSEARHLNRKFNQIIITAAMQLSLFAGDYR